MPPFPRPLQRLFRPTPSIRFSSTVPPSAPTAPPAPTRLASRGVLEVSGKDAQKFLQGLVTQNVPPPDGEGVYSAFLTPQGRMLYDVFLHPLPSAAAPTYLIDVDARGLEDLQKTMRKYVLRSKVKLRDASAAWEVWQGGEGGGLRTPDRRAPGLGWRVLREKEDQVEAKGTEEEYKRHRTLLGVPEGMDDFAHSASVPLECNVDWMNGVDFRKGCYVGQELTIRTHHTGVVRKRIIPFVMDPVPSSLPPPQTNISISLPSLARPKQAGKFLSAVGDVGLGLLRLEHVARADKGDGDLWFEDGEGKKVSVTPWKPGWWPKEEPEEPEGEQCEGEVD